MSSDSEDNSSASYNNHLNHRDLCYLRQQDSLKPWLDVLRGAEDASIHDVQVIHTSLHGKGAKPSQHAKGTKPSVNLHITKMMLVCLVDLPLMHVCSLLGVCGTVLKKCARTFGLTRWAQRAFMSDTVPEEKLHRFAMLCTVRLQLIKEASLQGCSEEFMTTIRAMMEAQKRAESKRCYPINKRLEHVLQEVKMCDKNLPSSAAVLQDSTPPASPPTTTVTVETMEKSQPLQDDKSRSPSLSCHEDLSQVPVLTASATTTESSQVMTPVEDFIQRWLGYPDNAPPPLTIEQIFDQSYDDFFTSMEVAPSQEGDLSFDLLGGGSSSQDSNMAERGSIASILC